MNIEVIKDGVKMDVETFRIRLKTPKKFFGHTFGGVEWSLEIIYVNKDQLKPEVVQVEGR